MASSTLTAPLSATAIAEFATGFRGAVFTPGVEGYDEVRAVFNAMHDRRPAVVVRPTDTADVVAAVNFARQNELLLSIKGGGHNVTGFATNDGGMVIDMGEIANVTVNAEARLATVGGGATWGQYDHATHAYGLATPSGIISTTGVAGLTMGGGFGHLTRRYGLTCDNLVSAEVVTADGAVRTANATTNSDLFWAIRGGGGNFGVVTSFTFKLHPVSTVYGGPIFYPVSSAGDVMKFFREFMKTAPREISAFFGFHIAPAAPFVPEHLHGHTACAIVVCYTGPIENAEAAIQPIRDAAPVALDLCGPIPYPALNSMFDALVPHGLHNYWKADFVRELTDEAIAVHTTHGPDVPNVQSLMHLYPMDGAVQDVEPTSTPFVFRDVAFTHIIAGIEPDPANMPERTRWVRDYWSALRPHSAGGAYVNFLMDEGQDRIKATYGVNYPRLQAVKALVDPENLFRMNQNIKPV